METPLGVLLRGTEGIFEFRPGSRDMGPALNRGVGQKIGKKFFFQNRFFSSELFYLMSKTCVITIFRLVSPIFQQKNRIFHEDSQDSWFQFRVEDSCFRMRHINSQL